MDDTGVSRSTGTFCGHCGQPSQEGAHLACAERLRMEPPRFCGQCDRRMQVQVTPTSWTARCVEHGQISSP